VSRYLGIVCLTYLSILNFTKKLKQRIGSSYL